MSLLPSTKFEMAISIPLYTEYQDVLTREEHMTGKSTRKEILAYCRYLVSISHRKDIFFLWRPWLKDPKDDMVLELAVASNSEYIITFNLDDFKRIYPFGIKVIKPADFLRLINQR